MWTQLACTARPGVWFLRGVLHSEGLLGALASAGDWVQCSTYRTAWAVSPGQGCCCSYAYGNSKGAGPHTGERCWSLQASILRAGAPSLHPCCADSEVPTSANLNLFGCEGSHVAWHSDNEGLFGLRGESKLIVSLNLGYPAEFKWKPQSSWVVFGLNLCRLLLMVVRRPRLHKGPS